MVMLTDLNDFDSSPLSYPDSTISFVESYFDGIKGFTLTQSSEFKEVGAVRPYIHDTLTIFDKSAICPCSQGFVAEGAHCLSALNKRIEELFGNHENRI
jgi:hypothetical protein